MNDYDVFRKHSDNLTTISQAGDVKLSIPRSIMSPTLPAHQFTLAEMFKKSIKRDASLLSTFKDRKFWDNRCRSTISTSNVKDVADVLDSDYSPTSPEEIDFFHE